MSEDDKPPWTPFRYRYVPVTRSYLFPFEQRLPGALDDPGYVLETRYEIQTVAAPLQDISSWSARSLQDTIDALKDDLFSAAFRGQYHQDPGPSMVEQWRDLLKGQHHSSEGVADTWDRVADLFEMSHKLKETEQYRPEKAYSSFLGLPVLVSEHLNPPKRVQFRFPRSRSKRIRRKWAKDPRNWRTVPGDGPNLVLVKLHGRQSIVASPDAVVSLYEAMEKEP